MTNAELREIIFNKIKELGFKIYNVENIDGYFICDMGKDSVTHFRLKGKGIWKHWKFGLWVNSKYMSEDYIAQYEGTEMPKVIQLFSQHNTWIDKFKPSRSALLFELDGEQVKNFIDGKDKNVYEESYTFNQMKTMLKMMCRHPFMCYDEYCGDYVGYTDKSFIWNYIKYETKEKSNNLSEKLRVMFWLPYTRIKISLCKRSNIINKIELYDFKKENKGWSTNYLYKVMITFNKDIPDEQICKWLCKWWKKDKYGENKYYRCIVKIDRFKQVGREESFIMVDKDKE